MAQVKSESELLRSSDVSAFSRWDLPSFDEAPHQVALEREPPEPQEPEIEDEPELEVEEVKPFTVEELEQIRQEAYNEGFATGEKDGFHSGQLKAQQEAKAVLAKRTAELDALMAQLMAPLKQQDEQIEDMLLMLLEQMLRAGSCCLTAHLKEILFGHYLVFRAHGDLFKKFGPLSLKTKNCL